jgi:predicted nucleic acid-binding protein
MRLFFDTNIIIDLISKRDGYEASYELAVLCQTLDIPVFVSAISVTDAIYILRKQGDRFAVRNALKTLVDLFEVVGVAGNNIEEAFAGAMPDFEDAVQSSCAKSVKADFIVTRNTSDFAHSPVPAITPSECIARINARQ